MMLCVTGLPFNFCFHFMKNVSIFHLSLIAHEQYWSNRDYISSEKVFRGIF